MSLAYRAVAVLLGLAFFGALVETAANVAERRAEDRIAEEYERGRSAGYAEGFADGAQMRHETRRGDHERAYAAGYADARIGDDEQYQLGFEAGQAAAFDVCEGNAVLSVENGYLDGYSDGLKDARRMGLQHM